MKRLALRCAFLALLTLSLSPARAAYNPAVVSADARWVVYVNLETLRASNLGKELVAAFESAQKQATGGTIGIDVPKLLGTVGAITAYGTNFVPDPKLVDGALIAQGTPELRKIAESILLQGTLAEPKVFSEVSDLPFPAYAISDPKAKEEDKTQLVIAFPPEPIVLVGKSKAQLVKARDVFRGTAASLAKTPASPLSQMGTKADGAYLFSASMVPTEPVFPQNAPQARILQLTSSAAIAIGERGSDTYAHAEMLASSEANAERLMKITQGLTAMLGLAETNDKQLAEFLQSVNVSRDKNTVTLDLAYASARLAQMVHNLRTESEAPRGANRQAQQTIVIGRTVAEWGGGEDPFPTGTYTGDPVSRTIENVKLANGTLITLGRALRGGKNARFTSVEIVPAEGAGAPLTFRPEFMRNVRGSMWQFPFPGAEGIYTFRVAYVPDPEGKTKYAVSLSEPKPAGEARSK